jgi:hypothetical protein
VFVAWSVVIVLFFSPLVSRNGNGSAQLFRFGRHRPTAPQKNFWATTIHYNKERHIMKPVSDKITLNNSLLQAISYTTNNSSALSVPVPPTTSPESEEAQRKRLVEILEFAIAMIDDFDFDPSGPSESHTSLGQ